MLNDALEAALKESVALDDENLIAVLRKYAKKVKSERKVSDTAV
jgi:hypothetical protein